MENFVAKGMIVDMAVHDPDKGEGIPNPHIHVMCPVRPMREDGTWGKSKSGNTSLMQMGIRFWMEKESRNSMRYQRQTGIDRKCWSSGERHGQIW